MWYSDLGVAGVPLATNRNIPANHWPSVYQSFDCGLSPAGRKAPPPYA